MQRLSLQMCFPSASMEDRVSDEAMKRLDDRFLQALQGLMMILKNILNDQILVQAALKRLINALIGHVL